MQRDDGRIRIQKVIFVILQNILPVDYYTLVHPGAA